MSDHLKCWPYREARDVLEHLEKAEDKGHKSADDPVIFETGFGPSGLPHIGTFSEVARTSWVRRAFGELSDRPTRLIAFSDDMDGLRKVPEDIPNRSMVAEHLGKPLCDIPDPFEEQESFAASMNARFCSFLDSFGFDYEFLSSKDQYRGGVFDEGLLKILRYYDRVRGIVARTLSEDSRDEWSPFFPVCENCGKVNNTRVVDIHPDDESVSYVCDQSFRGAEACGHSGTVPVTGGDVKVGWKVDWALRWLALGVDYEMYGKDLLDSVNISSSIVYALGGEPPAGMYYEFFLNEDGSKLSKSDGGGISIDDWLEYGPLESLSWFIFRRPEQAKKLYFDVIPRSTDQYLEALSTFGSTDERREQLDSPVFFIDADRIDAGERVGYDCDISYSLLLNLVSVLNTDDRQIIWDYLRRYDEDVDDQPELLDDLIDRAVSYYREFVLPTKEYELPDDKMMPGVEGFRSFLVDYDGDDSEEIQSAAYSAAKDHGLDLGEWFRQMYRLLLGQDSGPRLGTFVHLYGVDDTIELIDEQLAESSPGGKEA